jgi:hypothetical protein
MITPDLTNCTYNPITDTITLIGSSALLPTVASFSFKVLDAFLLQFYLNLNYGIAVYNSSRTLLIGADGNNGYTIKICYGYTLYSEN